MNKSSKFANQVVVVTGASSGIGRAVALAFARRGANTVLVARREDKLQEVSGTIHAEGGQATVIPADVSAVEQVQDMVEKATKRFGRVDVLVNNAGSSSVGAIDDPHFEADTKTMMAVDFFGTVHCTQAVLPVMRKQGKGHIVNMSSVVGLKAFPRFAGYSACMHAVTAFSDALRQELNGSGIHVSTIHPALTETPLLQHVDLADLPPPFRNMTPISPESVADAVVRAVQNRRRRVVVPWQPRLLLSADALSPWLGDWIVKLLPKSWFIGLLGMNRGRRYWDAQVD